MDRKFSSLVPLIFFTAVMSMAVALALPAAAHPEKLLFPAFLLGAAALLISLLHLGKKRRAPLALLGLGRSWLSREVFLAGGFVCAAGIGVLDPGPAAGGVAALSGLATVAAFSRVYHLPGQIGWRGWPHTLSPVTATLLAGAATHLAVLETGRAFAAALLVILVAMDAGLAVKRRASLARRLRDSDRRLAFPGLAEAGRRLFPVRFFLVIPAGAAVLFCPVPWRWTGLLVFGLVILADRFTFYAGAARETPRMALEEIRRERMNRAGNGVT